MHVNRRLVRRPHKRRRLLTIVAVLLAVSSFIFFLLPSSLFSNDLSEPEVPRNTLKAPHTAAPAIPTPSATATITTTTTTTAAPTLAPTTSTSTASPNATTHVSSSTPAPTQGGAAGQQEEKHKVENGNDSAQPAQPADGLSQLYAEELAALHVLDVFEPRPGEARVDFVRFAGCLGEMLAVDPVARTETPRPDVGSTALLPLLISATSGNTQDLKAMICNLSVPYKYVVLAQNGDTPEMTPFFNLLTRVFSFTRRLVVLQFLDSVGFAGAVNAGLREALRHPFDAVPFVHIIHNDVRYKGTALADSIKEAYLNTESDKDIIAQLEAEVKTEPNTHTPLIRQPHGLRAPLPSEGPLPQQSEKESVLVTSALLPDRIRYLPATERSEQLAERTSFIFHNSKYLYTAVYLTRLAIVATGFFDENFYPTMFDDTDFRWRAQLLGFTEQLTAEFDDAAMAFDLDCVGAKIQDEDLDQGRGGLGNAGAGNAGHLRMANRFGRRTVSPVSRALMRECGNAFVRGVQFQYMSLKWGLTSFGELQSTKPPNPPFASYEFSGKRHLPLDAWVVHTPRIAKIKRALRDTGVDGLDRNGYNPDVILDALK